MKVIVYLIILIKIPDLKGSFFYLLEYHPTYLQRRECIFESLLEKSQLPAVDLNLLLNSSILLRWLLLQTVYLGYIVPALPPRILAQIASLFLPNPPPISLNIIEIDIPAGVGSVAAYGVGVEETIMHTYIFNSDIPHSHSRLCLAHTFAKGIVHASGSVTVRLLHLLRSDVDAPPNGSVHGEVFEVQIFYDTGTLMTWVRFDVNAFDRPNHAPVAGSYVAYTVSASRWRQTAN
jgi:hypothetical protein